MNRFLSFFCVLMVIGCIPSYCQTYDQYPLLRELIRYIDNAPINTNRNITPVEGIAPIPGTRQFRSVKLSAEDHGTPGSRLAVSIWQDDGQVVQSYYGDINGMRPFQVHGIEEQLMIRWYNIGGMLSGSYRDTNNNLQLLRMPVDGDYITTAIDKATLPQFVFGDSTVSLSINGETYFTLKLDNIKRLISISDWKSGREDGYVAVISGYIPEEENSETLNNQLKLTVECWQTNEEHVQSVGRWYLTSRLLNNILFDGKMKYSPVGVYVSQCQMSPNNKAMLISFSCKYRLKEEILYAKGIMRILNNAYDLIDTSLEYRYLKKSALNANWSRDVTGLFVYQSSTDTDPFIPFDITRSGRLLFINGGRVWLSMQ